jgi:hypothetical protein
MHIIFHQFNAGNEFVHLLQSCIRNHSLFVGKYIVSYTAATIFLVISSPQLFLPQNVLICFHLQED